MSVDESAPKRDAQRLVAQAGRLRDTLAVRYGLVPREALTCRPADRVLDEARTAWLAGGGQPGGGVVVGEVRPAAPVGGPALWLRVVRAGSRALRRDWVVDPPRTRRYADVCVVTCDYPGRAAVQLLLMRPGETVVAVSRRAGPAEIEEAVAQIRGVVAGSMRFGDGTALFSYLSRSPLRGRVDHVEPGPSWLLAARGLVRHPDAQPPRVDTSSAVLLALPGPAVGHVIAGEWLAFHPHADTGTAPHRSHAGRRTELGVLLGADWAWAAVDGLIDTVRDAFRRLAGDPVVGRHVDERYAEFRRVLGGFREETLGQLRGALTNRRRALPDMPNRSVWRRFGVRRVTQIEQDTLLVDLWRGRSLKVQLVPTWLPGGDPAVRGEEVDDRLVVEVNVVADADRIEHDFWSRLAGALAIRYSVSGRPVARGGPVGEVVHFSDGTVRFVETRVQPGKTSDLMEEPSEELVRHTERRMADLTSRYRQVEEVVAWLDDVGAHAAGA